jgi:uncharacterized circularly permuted ATP-grasp superfamily protein
MADAAPQGGFARPFERYELGRAWDEMFAAPGVVREPYRGLFAALDQAAPEVLAQRQATIEREFLVQGVTFTVYGREEGVEQIIPTDLLPRIIPAHEWDELERGLKQRLQALNLFLADIYGTQRILRDRVVPRDLILGSPNFMREMLGVAPPHGAHVNVCGTDLIRREDGAFAVLEDNLRVPSGVSYMLANRESLRRAFPEVYRAARVRGVESYPDALLATLRSLAPEGVPEPTVVVLTPGVFNSAYYEHALLARLMGVALVEGRDLVLHDNVVYMRTTSGVQRVDVIYRRVDDAFIDPLSFRKDSVLGVPGLMNAYRAGAVVIANAPGCGVADDKAVYAYTPRIVRYYLDEDPILPIIETHLCREPAALSHVAANLDSLVVKAAGESGGYGMLVGPAASAAEREAFRARLMADPANYVAQPTIQLSTGPCFLEGGVEARHLDLRPFLLAGAGMTLVPGGLTRVALRKGSLVVNSSQGGGSKDTWVLAPPPAGARPTGAGGV